MNLRWGSPRQQELDTRNTEAPRSPALQLDFAELSDQGRTRDHNEDFLGHAAPASADQVRTHGWLFVVADGVGGQAYGEVASRTAVETIISGFKSAKPGEAHAALLPKLIQVANSHVYQAGHENGADGMGMATTVVSCALRYDRAVISHVGDSRCYLVRKGVVSLVTRDHTLVNEQLRRGLISASEAAEAQHRNVLLRSLGGDLFVNVDTAERQVQPGDFLLLCTDGFHGAVSDSQILNLIGDGTDLEGSTRDLVALANRQDGGDNISLQIIAVRNVERVGMYRGRPYRLV